MKVLNKIFTRKKRQRIAEIEGVKSNSIIAARKYCCDLQAAISKLVELDELINGARIEYKRGVNTKITFEAPWHSDNAILIIIFTICENPKPISAWIEEV